MTDAARRVVRDEVELLRLQLQERGEVLRHELQERGAVWLRTWLLVRIALPLAGFAWLAGLASLVTVLARRFDWPLAWLAVALINVCAALAFSIAARRAWRSGDRR